MKRVILALAGSLLCSGCAALGINNPLGGGATLDNAEASLKRNNSDLGNSTKMFTGEGCSTPAELKPYALNAANEYWFGRSVVDRLLAPYVAKKKGVYEPDAPAVVYLNEVGQAAVEGALLDRDEGDGTPANPRRFPTWKRRDATSDRPMPLNGYQFILVKDPAPGAWSTPGGFVVVTDGLLAKVASEEQLASVLAHEIAHVQRGHGVQVVEEAMCTDSTVHALAKNFETSTGGSDSIVGKLSSKAVGGLAQMVADRLINKGYDVGYEYEADAYGTRYLAAAGYSASALSDFLIAIQNDAAFSTANSKTHPPAATRAHFLGDQLDHENADSRHSPHEMDRAPRFQKSMGDAGIVKTTST